MMLTEEEAKTRLCPIMSKTNHWNHSDGSPDSTFDWENCKASGCMAWRWDIGPSYNNQGKGHCAMTEGQK